MSVVDQLIQNLQAAHGDTQAQAALTAEFAVGTRPEAERAPLHDALDAAAILRWFDAELLARTLSISAEDAQRRFEALRDFPFVERFPAHGRDVWNIHELTRLGWRKAMAREKRERFRELSARAAACFEIGETPSARIEWIYHLVSGDPERGAVELENLNRVWSGSARPEDRYALASALQELDQTDVVEGRARLWVCLVVAWTRALRGEEAQLLDIGSSALSESRRLGDLMAEGESQCLLGDARMVKGKLNASQAALGSI